MELNRVRHRHRDSEKGAADADADEDMLSKLPDDVLINILDRVDTLDAIRTCILSKRMHELLAMLSQVIILLGPRDLYRMNGVVADVTDRMLRRTRSRQAPITMRRVKLRFMLSHDDCLSIGKSVAFAMATQRLDAAEFEITTQTPSHADLIYFAKQFNTFLGDCPDAFAGLTRLHLENLIFPEPEDIPNILSTCHRLESLRLFQCDMATHLVLRVEHDRLVELDITFSFFITLELSFLPKLERLTNHTWLFRLDDAPLVLGFVPRLSKLTLINSNPSPMNMTTLLSDLLANAPCVRDLHMDFKNGWIWIRPEGPKLLAPVLGKIRVVSLDNLRQGHDIAWTMFILEAAPSLEELYIAVHRHRNPMEKTDVKWEPSVVDLKHMNLTKLTIHGFQSDSNFTGYVRRVIEAAVNIKEVSLHDYKVCQNCIHSRFFIKDLSSYPRTSEEMDSLRKKISEGLMTASPTVIYFRPSLP